MAGDFSKNLIKEYKYWEVYVFETQAYLGRCVIWCKRENAFTLTDATTEEQKELFAILYNLKEALEKIFQPDWLNYSFLGNETKHLHGHFIPRYAQPRTFMDMVFTDELYGHHYKPYREFFTPKEILYAIRDKLAEALK